VWNGRPAGGCGCDAAPVTTPDQPASDPFAAQRGTVLRVWREHAELLQATVARAAGLSDAALSAWERGERGVDLVKARDPRRAVRAIGERLGAPDALPALWAAVGSVTALPARSTWQHNFAPSGGPCWAWVRCPSGCEATAIWGIVHGRAQVPAGPGGLLVQFPASVNNPPLEALLSSPGWVDTGLGEVPPDVAYALGAEWVDARRMQVPRNVARLFVGPSRVAELGLAMRALRGASDRFRVRWELIAPHALDSLWPAAPAYPLDGADVASTSRPADPEVDDTGAVVRQALLTGTRLQALRTARGFPRQGTAEEVTALDPSSPCSRSAMQRLEDDGVLPRAALVLARLDTVFTAGGRVGVERVAAQQAGRWRGAPSGLWRWRVDFPGWWCGPVWLQTVAPSGPRQETVLHLEWGPWGRRQRVTGGLVVTTRKAPAPDGHPSSEPLFAGLPAGWRLVAGVGAVPTALDVGAGWRPQSALAALRLVEGAVQAVRRASDGPAL
jgi:hypothetical protein